MRRSIFRLNLSLFLLASVVSAQTQAVKVCVAQDNINGYDALRLAQELSSRKLAEGTTLAIVALTSGAPSPEWESRLTNPKSMIHWVDVTQKTAREKSAEMKRLGCDYNITVWRHDSLDRSGGSGPTDMPPPPEPAEPRLTGDTDALVYEMRKAGSKKVVGSHALPPPTVYARQEHRQFVPYPIFANEIVKKLSDLNSPSNNH